MLRNSSSSTSNKSSSSQPPELVPNAFGGIHKFLSVLIDEDTSEDESEPQKIRSSSHTARNYNNENEEVHDVLHANGPLNSDGTYSDCDEVFLSVCWKKGMLGAAVYSMESAELSVLNDIVDVNPEFNLTNSLFNQVQPKKVIACGSASIKFINMLKTLVNGEVSPGHDLADQKNLILLPGKEYVYEACKRRILNLQLPGFSSTLCPEEQTWYLKSILDLQAESMVLSLGMLLKCLEKSFVHLNLEAGQNTAPISEIRHIDLENLVTIDSETFRALQIFNQVSHPSNFVKGVERNNKEGLSIYGIFNRCKTFAGAKCMRTMLLRPSRDIEVINHRLDVVEYCYNPRNDEMMKSMQDHLKSIKSINRVMTRFVAAKVTMTEWKTLYKSIYHCISLGEICQRISSHAKLFEEMASCNTDELYHMVHCIDSIIDFNESEKLNKFSVKIGLDEELDKKKQKYGMLPELMSRIAKTELEELPSYVKECSAVYIPEIGFILAIPEWQNNISEQDAQIPGLELMFSVGNIIHYKSEKTRELDVTVGDCVIEISEHESRIMVQLIQFVQEHLPRLQHMMSLAAELDCLIAFAIVALENNYSRPTLSTSRVIDIQKGRHPLQELCVENFVPNDTLSGGDNNDTFVKILTGPNSSGKSVYLKQVALIVYLAHVGSFVPADKAIIGIVDHIHTRIQTIESVATLISAFAIDLKQMIRCLYSSTPSSLIIIDEFGKGTSEESGLALLGSCLKHFLSRESNCPHIFVSTHFHRIASLLTQSPICSFQTFEYMFDENERIVYLYKLKDGNVTSSLAVKVLEMLSVSESSVKKSSEFLKALKSNKLVTRDPSSRRSAEIKMRKEIAAKFLSSTFTEDDIQELTAKLRLYKYFVNNFN